MVPEPRPAEALARELLEGYRARGLRVATAESCTGGLVAAAITDLPGSSAIFDRGFVTYSNPAKEAMLGIPAKLIEAHGAVSEPVARAMAEGARVQSDCFAAVSVTGVAGPGGGTAEKPVGLVHFAISTASETWSECERFEDNGRDSIRWASTEKALRMLLDALGPRY